MTAISSEDGIFTDEWCSEQEFQGWLVKVSNDDRRAYCRYCALVLRAQKGDLLSHAKNESHITNSKVAQDGGVPPGPISVQIVLHEDDFSQPVGEEEVEDADVDDPLGKSEGDSERHRKRSNATGKRYIKKYRTAWEEEPEFKDWLQHYPDDVQRAFCKACKAILRAHKHDLTCHARTTRHQKKMDELKEQQGGEQLFQMIAEDVVTMPHKRNQGESSNPSGGYDIGIEIDASGIFPDNGDGDERRAKVLKMSKSSRKETPKSVRKRPRFTAADVVAAIENDEFTGYELLQIVKKAVPKL